MASVGRMKLGSQRLEVSKQGLGCMGMSAFYGLPKPEPDMISLIHHAVGSGITFLDTSDMYGPFTNESLLGKVTFFIIFFSLLLPLIFCSSGVPLISSVSFSPFVISPSDSLFFAVFPSGFYLISSFSFSSFSPFVIFPSGSLFFAVFHLGFISLHVFLSLRSPPFVISPLGFPLLCCFLSGFYLISSISLSCFPPSVISLSVVPSSLLFSIWVLSHFIYFYLFFLPFCYFPIWVPTSLTLFVSWS